MRSSHRKPQQGPHEHLHVKMLAHGGTSKQTNSLPKPDSNDATLIGLLCWPRTVRVADVAVCNGFCHHSLPGSGSQWKSEACRKTPPGSRTKAADHLPTSPSLRQSPDTRGEDDLLFDRARGADVGAGGRTDGSPGLLGVSGRGFDIAIEPLPAIVLEPTSSST